MKDDIDKKEIETLSRKMGLTKDFLKLQQEYIEECLGWPQCHYCRNLIEANICRAFPERIPLNILSGMFIHDKRHPGQDNEILFEAKS